MFVEPVVDFLLKLIMVTEAYSKMFSQRGHDAYVIMYCVFFLPNHCHRRDDFWNGCACVTNFGVNVVCVF